MVTTICGWCGDEIDGVALDDHDDECSPACQLCGEQWDAKSDAVDHDCPERDGAVRPAPDRVPEDVRLERREKRRREAARAYRKRQGIDR